MNIVLHGEKSKGTDQGHHGLAMGGGLGHDVDHRCIVAVEEQALSLQLGSPDSQGHGNCIRSHQFMLICWSLNPCWRKVPWHHWP